MLNASSGPVAGSRRFEQTQETLDVPDRPSAGEWRVGIVASESSDEQVAALEPIFTGKDGGPWGAFSGLFSEYMGLQRASVRYADGETPHASVEGYGELTFEPFRNTEGKPTMLAGSSVQPRVASCWNRDSELGQTQRFARARSKVAWGAWGLAR